MAEGPRTACGQAREVREAYSARKGKEGQFFVARVLQLLKGSIREYAGLYRSSSLLA